jgi:hypothetical protein
MMTNSEFGIRNSEWPHSTFNSIGEGRAENPKSEIRNPKFHRLGGEA